MICNNCGATFDEQDVVHYREDYGEIFSACPVCGDYDISDSAECVLCGEEMDPGDLREGFCLQCLWDEIDYDVALAYMQDRQSLGEFILNDWMGTDSKIGRTTPGFDKFTESVFKQNAHAEETGEVLLGGAKNFLRAARKHCLPYYPNGFGMEGGDFAEWYAEYRKEANEPDPYESVFGRDGKHG